MMLKCGRCYIRLGGGWCGHPESEAPRKYVHRDDDCHHGPAGAADYFDIWAAKGAERLEGVIPVRGITTIEKERSEMKPSERIKQLATDIRNTDMLGNRLATSHTTYIEAIIQFLDEALAVGKFSSAAGVPQETPPLGRVIGSKVAWNTNKWSWDADLAAFETLAINLRNDGQTSRAEVVEYLIARCRRAEMQVAKLVESWREKS